MSKTVCLLGAGASIPYISYQGNRLLTSYLNSQLLDESRWIKTLDAFNVVRNSRGDADRYCDNLEVRDIFQVLTRIDKSLKSSNGFNVQNFEQVIHILDKLSSLIWTLDDQAVSLDSLLLSIWPDKPAIRTDAFGRGSEQDGWLYVPFLAREVIIDTILELWENNEEDRRNALNLNQDFFTRLCNSGPVSIYSLNYDPLLAESLRSNGHFMTGFEDGPFDSIAFWGAENPIAFLHGHVGFVPSKDGISLLTNYVSARERRFKASISTNINDIGQWGQGFTTSGMKGMNPNSFFVTGQDKLDGFSFPPFTAYLHRFAVDLHDADVILMIGYSLGDYHLNTFLQNLTKDGEKRRIIFCSLGKDLILPFLNGLGISINKYNWKGNVLQISDQVIFLDGGTDALFQETDINVFFK